MKAILYKTFVISTLVVVLGLGGCQDDWLTAKRDLNTVLPKTLDDLTSILHADLTLSLANDYAGAQLARDDDHYTSLNVLNSLGESDRKLYMWDMTIYDGSSSVSEWNSSYEQIFYANVVLEQLNSIERVRNNMRQWDQVRGSALFFRAKSHYNVVRQFALPYLPDRTEPQGEGIPLRLSSDPNVVSVRASLADTYDRIIGDLKESVSLLSKESETKITPSKAAAYGLLARILLGIGNYPLAEKYADSCLQLQAVLLDYHNFQVVSDGSYPFPLFNDEVIFHSYLMPQYGVTSVSNGIIDSVLMASYVKEDLRRDLFFTSKGGFRGNYTASNFKFSGIAVDEILLIRAECRARSNREAEALVDLNALLSTRIAGFTPYSGITGKMLLDLILMERRKQLLFRGVRWDDLRRLNIEGHQISLVRNLNGENYVLTPNNRKYALPIPHYVISASKIKQNEW